jgi:hypothetical protein
MVDKMGAKNYDIFSWHYEVHLCSCALPVGGIDENGVL